ncbi:MAG: DNA polymerase III subunit alpha [Odoribacteraceae bacterium]|jgi:DNA polymerase-3 subunit alpha|nr:DNA polymerase III subunit alpha [Odoribacteraceae bacterium]
MVSFTHFHVHSQYSILDGAASITGLVEKARADGMRAVALTDHGNMFGIKMFHDTCRAAGIKPVLGVEAYVARVSLHDKEKEIDRSGEHLVLLAKNHRGYKNLTQLCSIAYTEGFYYRPRVDKALLERYHEGLIASSACLGGEICQKIMRGDVSGAEETARWYREVFGEDYYLEVMRHPSGDSKMDAEVYRNQQACNPVILELGAKLGIKVIATNDVHFLDAEDAEAHDILICLNTGKDIDDPNRLRYTRQEWFKTTAEMEALFADIPEVLENTREIEEKVEEYTLKSDPIMPVFPIPGSFGREEEYAGKFSEEQLMEEFGGRERYEKLGGYEKVARIKFEADYLAHLTWIGAGKRWQGELPDAVRERVEFELNTIKTMGFPGYFLIVQDFIRAAREMGVIVGPGRGSAAGSVVAYCLEITNIDPVRYDLLFERFLNPDRISMPDIDIDFDDDGRQQVLEWVAEKYGREKVAHIVTFGSMAAKMAIKDVARVLRLPLSESNRLSKMVPEAPKMTLALAYEKSSDLVKEKEAGTPNVQKTLTLAEKLDGTVRQPGVHACGVIISRDALSEHVPVMPSKDDSLLTTQYDGHFVESIGLLKMDFLGLKTLSIIKICLNNIQKSRGVSINIDEIPLDDPVTFALFSRGETTALFQFESDGMKKHLKALQPDNIEFLVAMNALYRPGPMDYIPNFIKRRHGQEPVVYDHPMMEPYLKGTYGITVYQEQVMLLSRALARFTRGESDTLRKAMGKKQKEEMNKMRDKFTRGCSANPEFLAGCEAMGKQKETLIEKIWEDWEHFASYAFNKSHAVCYAYIAYQTGYLKANYPSEFMAANLSCNLSQIAQVSKLMDECKRMGLRVLPPDVNESDNDFTVNRKGDIRFGLAAIKGVGEGAVDKIKEERAKNGLYKDVFDFFERIDYRTVNQKALENIIAAGGLDSFGLHRAHYFCPIKEGTSWLEQLINYGKKRQADQEYARLSLFGGMAEYEVAHPEVPECEPWMNVMQANKEKELIGIYLTTHPLDAYKMEVELLCTKLKTLEERLAMFLGRTIVVAGIVIAKREGKTRQGHDFGILTIEDFSGAYEIPFFGEEYIRFRNYFIIETPVYLQGRVQKKKWKEDELEFKVLDMRLMGELKSLVRSITIEIDAEQLTTGIVTELGDRLQEEGSIPVHVILYDRAGNSVKLFARNYRVECSKELYEYFERNDMIKIKID